MEQTQQELMFKLSMYEQQIQQLQQQIRAVEQAIVDLNSLSLGLEEMIGAKGKEIMAPIGRGIFVKTKLLSEDLVVDIGGKNFVKKSIPDTKKLIDEQIEKLEAARNELNDNLEILGREIEEIIEDAQRKE